MDRVGLTVKSCTDDTWNKSSVLDHWRVLCAGENFFELIGVAQYLSWRYKARLAFGVRTV